MSEVAGQHRVREAAMESADLGQKNPAVPLSDCTTLGVPPKLPEPLEKWKQDPASQSGSEGSGQTLPVL